MTKRTKENLRVIVLFAVLGILLVFAVKTVWVGMNLAFCSNAVVESSMYADEYPQIRAEADAVYERVSLQRASFYHSNDMYIRFLSNMNSFLRIPFGLFMIFSPYLFVMAVRNHNLNKRRRRRTRG